MSEVNHYIDGRFFNCLLCGDVDHLETDCGEPITEIWRCHCGELFTSSETAIRHMAEAGHRSVSYDPAEQRTAPQPVAPQSFAAGWNNFATV